MLNVVGASSKRCDMLQDKQASIVAEALENGEISSGRGMNQQTSLKSLIVMFKSTIEVLEKIVDDGSSSEQRFDANNLLESMQSFDFVFNLHFMRSVLGVSNELLKALQKKDQDIVNAMTLVKICK